MVAAILELLEEDDGGTPAPRALLSAGDVSASPLALVHEHVASHPASEAELAFLANTLLAGCSLQGRAFTILEASDCALAVCNLGLENWPAHWPDRSLIDAFRAGWAILHRKVCLATAQRLVEILPGVSCGDEEVQRQLKGLRRTLIQQMASEQPWRVRERLDAILMLDATAWAALNGLLAECPVVHAAVTAEPRSVRTIEAGDFAFVSRNAQISAVRDFVERLPEMLAG